MANMGGFKFKLWIQNLQNPTFTKPVGGRQQLDKIVPKDRPEGHFLEGVIKNYQGLDYLRQFCRDLHIPDEEDLKALSKRDSFTKLFAIVQSAWLVVQCIARASIGLPITQLELSTVAFVVCGVVMYGLWWNKPYGIERRELLVAITNEIPRVRYDNWHFWSENENDGPHGRSIYADCRVEQPDILDLVEIEQGLAVSRVDNRVVPKLAKTPTFPSLGGEQAALYIGGTAFSAFHILAWNWDFPNTPARIIWRVLAITATCVGPVLLLSFYLLTHRRGFVLGVIIWGLLILYSISRAGLIVLIFYCFSSMPMDVYKTAAWTNFLPHLA